MTIRRKFFPTRPVQTEPGRSVDVTVQLHRGGSVAPAPCVIHGAHWSTTLPSGYVEEFWTPLDRADAENAAQGDWDLEGLGNGRIGGFRASYQGEHHVHPYIGDGGTHQEQLLEGPHFFCTHLKISRAYHWGWVLGQVVPPVLLGTLLGSHMTDAHWTATWEPAHPTNSGKSADGDYHLTAGNALYVYPVFKNIDEPGEEEGVITRLQATAWCGGKPVAQLSLHIHDGYLQ